MVGVVRISLTNEQVLEEGGIRVTKLHCYGKGEVNQSCIQGSNIQIGIDRLSCGFAG